MGFSTPQLKALAGKLDRRHVQTRKLDDKDINYIEGWFAISEANAIFGFGGWDRETTHWERVFERTRNDVTTCCYLVRVKIGVRAGATRVMREGSGVGTASSKTAAEAHERAIKAAETDATKRALATFGNRFGLCLYDKERAGVTARITPARFRVMDCDGAEIASGLSPEAFCSALRQVIQKIAGSAQVEQIASHNAAEIVRLRIEAPSLRTSKGHHFADVLEGLLRRKQDGTQECWPARDQADASGQNITNATQVGATTQPLSLQAQPTALAIAIDKSVLPIAVTKRVRDKDHIRHVGTLPCVVCEQSPSHAHHLTFAQPRGLSLKVSDEFVVPLCVIHHNEIHRSGSELLWWKRLNIEPLAIAKSLWERWTATQEFPLSQVG